MTSTQKIPTWLGTAVALVTLCLGLVANYADRVKESALLDSRVAILETKPILKERVESLEEKHKKDDEDAKRLQTVETMVCLIGAHLKVPGLGNGNCHAP